MDKEIEKRLLEKKARLTLKQIIDGVKEKDNKDMHIEFALEKFENYVTRFGLNVSEKEFQYLSEMRVKMHDGNGLAPKNIIPINDEIRKNTVTVVDFKAKKRITPC